MKMTYCLAIVAVLAVSGSMSHDDDELSVSHYCDMVDSGAWPDYNKSIDCSVGGGE